MQTEQHSPAQSIPQIKGWPILGVALEFQRNPLAFISQHSKTYPDLFSFKLAQNTMYFTNNPDYIHHIFQKNFANYDKKNIMYKEMAILFGEATSVVDGERWKEGNKVIQPSLSMKKIVPMMDIINQSLSALVERWKSQASKNQYVKASDDLANTTLDIIVKSMFGTTINGQEKVITESFKTILEIIVDRVIAVVKMPTFIPTPQNLRYQKAIKNIDTLLYKIIEEKLKSNPQPPKEDEFQDMLAQWILALKDSENNVNFRKKLRDEIIGIFVAGHGSSATFLSWMLYHLAAHPEIQAKLYQELHSILNGRIPTVQDFGQLKYTKAVIEESMRITPPGWVISRSTIEADQLGPYRIPAKSMILLSPYLMHHNTKYWDRPEVFDPERFFGPNSEKTKQQFMQCSYIPFTAGPRICTGRNLAMVEATLFLAHLIQKFKLELKPDQSAIKEGSFTLNLKGGLDLKLTER